MGYREGGVPNVSSHASFAFAGVLMIALVAVVGFAAFSTGQGDVGDIPVAAESPQPIVPTTASGRVLGAVVAAALTAEPTIEIKEEVADKSTLVEAAVSPDTTNAPKPVTATPRDTAAPEIVITWPSDNETVTDRAIQFTGKTEKGATIKSGNYFATVDEDGNWKIKLSLLAGRNRAYFTSSDKAGNEATVGIVVNYDAPATTTTEAPSTTTEPPVEGGRRNVEEWRYLVEQYFLPELTEEALIVMKCESRGDPLAYNQRSGASGLFQFISNTWNWASKQAGWAGANAFDPEANTAAAAWLTQRSINRGQDAWSHWSCKPHR
jgi:hypothetical protein